MKKIIAFLLALTMVFALAACGTKPDVPGEASNSGSGQTQSGGGSAPVAGGQTQSGTTEPDGGEQTQIADTGSAIPEGAVTDETKLGEAVSYFVDGDYLYLKIKTSYEFDVRNVNFDIVNPGIYLTRNSEFITQAIFGDFRCFAEEYDKEWFEGTYVFYLDNGFLTNLASDESGWAPGTWSMLMYEADTGLVIGEWFIVLEGGGKYHFEYKDAWLRGAGEDKKVKEYDSLEKELEACFRFLPEESYDEWATFDFDGFYLEETDLQGYDHHFLMVCPEGDYATYEEADAVDLTYTGIGVFAHRSCPYRFSFEQYGIEPGRYTMVLARMGGDVEIQFTAEKVSATEWKLDFSNAKCPRLESKYSGNPEQIPSAPDGGGESSDSEVLNACGLTVDNIRTAVGASMGEALETPTQYIVPVFCADASFESFESWLYALADNCRKAAKDGSIYESEFTAEPLTSFELEPGGIHIVQFVYKTAGHTVYVTASESGSVENAFSCNIQVY